MSTCPYCLGNDASDRAISPDEIEDLAAAIRRGNLGEAEYILDNLAAKDDVLAHRLQVGRYSPRAKAA